jgi:uncharacterized Zn finger protein (UPF0148 family)
MLSFATSNVMEQRNLRQYSLALYLCLKGVTKMATNYNNEFCVQCETFTYKGDGIRLEHNGSWRTFCTTCAAARQANKNTAVSRAAYRNRQPKLFTEEVKEMKEQTFRPMTDRQVAYIRDLFAYNKEYMTIDEQESLVSKMKGHIDGSAVLSIVWAGKAIDKLKTYRDHTKWFSLLNYYAKGLHLNQELKIVPIEKGEEQ